MSRKSKKADQAGRRKSVLGLLILCIVILCIVRKQSNFYTESDSKAVKKHRIALDPGHGGKDPGKIGVNGVLEKDINLQVAMLLKQELEKKGCKVFLTRSEDTTATGDYDGKKAEDMRQRVELMNEAKADICVSIHMNSYEKENAVGPQLFYYCNSKEGEKLAEKIQASVKERISGVSIRESKENDSYYILRKSPCPAVIMECGFLSNPGEAEKLTGQAYQKELSEAICVGIMNYFSP